MSRTGEKRNGFDPGNFAVLNGECCSLENWAFDRLVNYPIVGYAQRPIGNPIGTGTMRVARRCIDIRYPVIEIKQEGW